MTYLREYSIPGTIAPMCSSSAPGRTDMREVRREKQLCRVFVDLSLICLWRDFTMLGTWAWRRERGLGERRERERQE